MPSKIFIVFFLFGFGQNIFSDALIERPIENRNLYLPFLLFLEPYPTTPKTLEKGKMSIDSGKAISNMIDNNNAPVDYGSNYSTYKPLYWSYYSKEYADGSLTPNTYYLSELLTYGRLEQQSHVRIDAEIQRFHTKLSYGLFKNFEIGLDISALSYNTGIFDRPITGFHRTVGIPYPLRDIYSDNQFGFHITDNMKYVVKGKLGTSLGDSVLDAKWKLREQNGWLPTLAWINSVKIPTGNTNLSMGTGKPDLATGISSKWNFDYYFVFVNLFGIIPSDPFNSREIHVKPFAALSSTLGYTFTEKFSVVGQFEIKGSPYHSAIRLLNQTAVLLSFGLNWKVFPSCALRVNFTEDPITRSVPDVSVQTSLLCLKE